ncbi:MAG TPA: pyridoxal phosphate-dependent aminotransferase [Casimicrobiaceae bacterium]|nr:pyridoxal phosphate-dependent aminotransferase [Casimicrobiaceae bacterium]
MQTPRPGNPEFPASPDAPRATARATVGRLDSSKIREIANAGMGVEDILAFWFGEPDQVTPAFIRDAASASLARGETFYTQNLGVPALREAIAAYVTRLHAPTPAARIAVTASGMSALMLTAQALVDPGDRVVAVTPLWPNLTGVPRILSAGVERVSLSFGPSGWTLDVDRLLEALTPGTRALLLNSPNNPTGWTIDRQAQRAVFDHCDRHGIWIVADDVYERLYYGDDADCAPSFLGFAHDGARLVSTNSFSKAWMMTGFRLGWIVAPAALMADIGKLIEFNTSCSPAFVQSAGVAALTLGETSVAATRARLRHARDRLIADLQRIPGVQAATPQGAMYALFRVAGVDDSLAFCKRLVAEAGLGLAPGSAFGPDGEGFVRWCFAATDTRLDEGVARLGRFLEARQDLAA